MPCVRRTRSEREEHETRIQAALGSLHSNKCHTPGEAARIFRVHPTTLRNRWLGVHKANSIAHVSQRLLSHATTEALVSWCIHLSLTSQPLDRTTIGRYVHSLCGKYPSPSWVDRFLREHKDVLALRSATGIDPKRARAFNEPTVRRHFELFGSVVRDKGIPAENTYNMDEKGAQLGGGRKRNGRKFICGREQRTVLKLQDSNLELVTIVECTSANGQALRPGFILTGTPGSHHEQWYEREGVGSIAISPSGWTDDELTYLWFTKVFVPQAMARNVSGKPIMLIMDGHGSHCTDEMREYGYACNPRVHIYLLPPHTTHRLQPLDVGVFGVAQRRWSRLCDQRVAEGNLITRDTVVSEWMDLRSTFMREDIIRSSFQKTGLYPLNPNVFSAEDFAPSRSFSVKSHLPAGYPLVLSENTDGDNSGATEDTPENCVVDTTPIGASGVDPASTNGCSIKLEDESSNLWLEGPLEMKKLTSKLRDGTLPPPGTRLHTKAQLLAEVARLRDCLTASVGSLEAATAHARLMATQNEELQKRLNTKKRGGKRKIHTDARLVTSDEFVALRRNELEREQEETKKAAKKAEQRDKERIQREHNRTTTAHKVVWNPGWRNRKKDDLKDLCYVLGLSMEGTRETMVKRIEAHLQEAPALSTDYRFRGLFAVAGSDGVGCSQVTVT